MPARNTACQRLTLLLLRGTRMNAIWRSNRLLLLAFCKQTAAAWFAPRGSISQPMVYPSSQRLLHTNGHRQSPGGDTGDDPRDHARSIFRAAVQAVLPATMVERNLKLEGSRLTLGTAGVTYHVDHNVRVVAFGKAVLGMVKAAEDILGSHIVDGAASVPKGIRATMQELGKSDLLPSSQCPVKVMEGARDNIPDEDAHHAALHILRLLESCKEGDVVLTLISGGGSALLPSPIPPLTLEELSSVTKVLSQAGATIQQLNIVRKHLELLKGGGLARAAYPAKVVALIMSDVIGNDLQFIASGPTLPSTSTSAKCRELIRSLGVEDKLPKHVYDILDKTAEMNRVELSDSNGFTHVENVLVGTNSLALAAASQEAERLNYATVTLTSLLEGDANEVGRLFARLAGSIHGVLNPLGESTDDEWQHLSLLCKELSSTDIYADLKELLTDARSQKRPVCLLAGGETTVRVEGDGRGGRNQQMALASAISMQDIFPGQEQVCFLSAGTDGQDGPCPAAGAVVDRNLIPTAANMGLTPADYLLNNDTYHFFSKVDGGSYHVVTGFTGTNVMDVQVLLVFPKQQDKESDTPSSHL